MTANPPAELNLDGIEANLKCYVGKDGARRDSARQRLQTAMAPTSFAWTVRRVPRSMQNLKDLIRWAGCIQIFSKFGAGDPGLRVFNSLRDYVQVTGFLDVCLEQAKKEMVSRVEGDRLGFLDQCVERMCFLIIVGGMSPELKVTLESVVCRDVRSMLTTEKVDVSHQKGQYHLKVLHLLLVLSNRWEALENVLANERLGDRCSIVKALVEEHTSVLAQHLSDDVEVCR